MLEVVVLGAQQARLVVRVHENAAAVTGFGVGQRLTVHHAKHDFLLRRAGGEQRFEGLPLRVIARAECLPAFVPGADDLAGRVVQIPARPGVHARLAQRPSSEIGVAARDHSVDRVD